MQSFFGRHTDQRLRERLVAAILRSDLDFDGELKDDTSLIKSGLLDSLGLFNVAVTIEREIGPELDLTSFDLSHEWDTITDMLRFVTEHRVRGKPRQKRIRPH